MRISLLVIGRPRHAGLAEAIRDYETRAARYWPLDVVEVKEESGRGLTPMLVMDREAERLVERIPADAQIVACDPGGEVMDSTRFAGWLQDQREQAARMGSASPFGAGRPADSRWRRGRCRMRWRDWCSRSNCTERAPSFEANRTTSEQRA